MFEESSLSILREECGNKDFFSGKVWSINFRFRYVYKTPAKCDLDNDIYFERPCNKPQILWVNRRSKEKRAFVSSFLVKCL